jgi:phage tail protein X
MATLKYTTKEGDMVDELCWRYYGIQSGAVEQVYDANPNLAGYGPILPQGVVITLPELTTEATDTSVNLWE